MIDINKEAEEWCCKSDDIPARSGMIDITHCELSYIAGHNSKATQAKVIQAQIDILEGVDGEYYYSKPIFKMIEELQQQLKQLKQ